MMFFENSSNIKDIEIKVKNGETTWKSSLISDFNIFYCDITKSLSNTPITKGIIFGNNIIINHRSKSENRGFIEILLWKNQYGTSCL